MTKIFLLLVSASLLFAAPAFAKTQVFTLKDGSQIKGELVEFEDGIYTVNTTSFGEMQINQNEVVSVADPGATPAVPTVAAPAGNAARNSELSQQVSAMQTQLMANPEFLADLQQMAQDPEIMNILSDPALVQAVTSKDVTAIQTNPRAKQLMDNPKMQALIEKLQASNQSQQTE